MNNPSNGFKCAFYFRSTSDSILDNFPELMTECRAHKAYKNAHKETPFVIALTTLCTCCSLHGCVCVCVRASRRVFVCCSQTNSTDVVSTWRALIINTDKAREGLACSMNKPRGWAGGVTDR